MYSTVLVKEAVVAPQACSIQIKENTQLNLYPEAMSEAAEAQLAALRAAISAISDKRTETYANIKFSFSP
jgi:hypothetical protein